MNNKTAFQRDILFIIRGHEKPKGLEIKSHLEDYYDQEVNHGRLYPNLDQLANEGLVQKGKKDDRTNEYQLTEEGEKALWDRLDWQSDLTDP